MWHVVVVALHVVCIFDKIVITKQQVSYDGMCDKNKYRQCQNGESSYKFNPLSQQCLSKIATYLDIYVTKKGKQYV